MATKKPAASGAPVKTAPDAQQRTDTPAWQVGAVPVCHDGVRYAPGAVIVLTSAQAARLGLQQVVKDSLTSGAATSPSLTPN